MDRPLLDDAALAVSSVVANNAMNRERQLAGANSYTGELGFNPADLVGTGWLDLCCGSGTALAQAADARPGAYRPGVDLVGVDLVDTFVGHPGVEYVCADLSTWAPERRFDLITCVHGLHYIGDKLGLLARVAGWLTPGGRLVADLDLGSIRRADGQPAGRPLANLLRAAGFTYDPRRHRIGCTGPREVRLPYRYLGADDRAGANYTGQAAVHSYYESGN